MRPKVPWTKSMLEKFIEEALLTPEEERILRTRIAGWSIVKQSTELHISTSTISRVIRKIRKQYLTLQIQFPDIFPKIKASKFDDLERLEPVENGVIGETQMMCEKSMNNMTVEEIVECQKACPFEQFYSK